MRLNLLTACAVAATAFTITAAQATTVTFGPTGWVYNGATSVPWVVTIDDDTANIWTVTLSNDAGAGDDIGSFLGFGFDSVLTGLTASSFAFVSSNTGEGINSISSNTLTCGSGCNFNGDGRTAFDWVIGLGNTGASVGLLTDFVFTIATGETLAINSFTRVGVRAQSIGAYPNGGGGSAKDVNLTPVIKDPPDSNEPPTVPLPAGGVLLLTGLVGLGAASRKRRRK